MEPNSLPRFSETSPSITPNTPVASASSRNMQQEDHRRAKSHGAGAVGEPSSTAQPVLSRPLRVNSCPEAVSPGGISTANLDSSGHEQVEIPPRESITYKDGFHENAYDGYGELTEAGVTYKGQLKNGERHGLGEYTFTGGTYIGRFESNIIHGQGEIIYDNGTCYKGQFIRGEYDGQGEITYSDSSWYKGQFKRGKYNGQGELLGVDGTHYKGQFKDDKFELGEVTYKNGDFYKGQWKDDKPQPHGYTECIHSGASGKGQFKNGDMDGQGEVIYDDGTYRKGQFKQSELDGQGEETYSDGSSYKGQFKHGEYDGQGELICVDGTHYKGQFKDGKYDGQGELISANGTHYKGQFKDDICDGQGEAICANGTHYKGQFKDNKLHGLGEATLSDGAQLKGQFKNHQYEGWPNQSSRGRPQQLVAVAQPNQPSPSVQRPTVRADPEVALRELLDRTGDPDPLINYLRKSPQKNCIELDKILLWAIEHKKKGKSNYKAMRNSLWQEYGRSLRYFSDNDPLRGKRDRENGQSVGEVQNNIKTVWRWEGLLP
ncbi:hypothetical protein RU639_010417 [Aspergillus parasiticus]